MAKPLRDEKGHWLKGQSGNLHGSPTGIRDLTRKLQEKLLAEVEISFRDISSLPSALKRLERDGKCVISPADFLVSQLANLVIERKLYFPDGAVWEVTPEVYTEIYRWMFAQIDGAPRTELDVTSNGKTIVNWDLFERADKPVQSVHSNGETDGGVSETPSS